jgi:hypothetical protein
MLPDSLSLGYIARWAENLFRSVPIPVRDRIIFLRTLANAEGVTFRVIEDWDYTFPNVKLTQGYWDAQSADTGHETI